LGFLTALEFLTIIPVPGNRKATTRDFGQSLAYFPLVGFLLGAILYGIYIGLGYITTTPINVVLTIIALVILTGAHHMDGLMDTFDGIVSARTREERLAIMADSHVGAFGVISVVLLLLLKFASLYATPSIMQSLLLMPVLSRWIVVTVIYIFPYAKQSGMGLAFKQGAKWPGLLVATIIALIISGLLMGWKGIILAAIVFLVMLAIGYYFRSRLGGLTGDNYGAVNEIAEVLVVILIISLHGG
jgi:adenosylcobinamide-GDP ribazoletransferase